MIDDNGVAEDSGKVKGRRGTKTKYIIEDLFPANRVHLIGGPSGSGKAQPLSVTLQAPDGPILMKDIEIGSKLLDSSGGTQRVLGVYPQGPREVYKITFEDGRQAESTWDHLWLVEHSDWTAPEVKTLAEIKLKLESTKVKISVPLTKAVEYPETQVHIHPYLMGALLGDGSFRNGSPTFSSIDLEVLEIVKSHLPTGVDLKHISRCDYRISSSKDAQSNPVLDAINYYGLKGRLSNEKFIPSVYLSGSVAQAYQLLQGLLDTDGYVDAHGRVYFYSTSLRMAQEVRTLIWRLGGMAKLRSKNTTFVYKGESKHGKVMYEVFIKMFDPAKLFLLPRKLARTRPPKSMRMFIKSIIFDRVEECQCIRVSAKDHLYQTGSYILTHNTTLMFQMYKALTAEPLPLEFLGRRTNRVRWGYISGDRAVESVYETQERLGVEFPVFSLVDENLVGADLGTKILPRLTAFYGYRPDFVYIDGFTGMCPDGLINNYKVVSSWLAGLQRYCKQKGITILGACHTTKTKEGEKFLNPRQQILGSVAWASYSEGVVIIEPMEGGDDRKRVVSILPRNHQNEQMILTLNSDGMLELPDKVAKQDAYGGFIVEAVLGTVDKAPGTRLNYRGLLEQALSKGASRRTFDRYLAKEVEEGRLIKNGKGVYAIGDGADGLSTNEPGETSSDSKPN